MQLRMTFLPRAASYLIARPAHRARRRERLRSRDTRERRSRKRRRMSWIFLRSCAATTSARPLHDDVEMRETMRRGTTILVLVLGQLLGVASASAATPKHIAPRSHHATARAHATSAAKKHSVAPRTSHTPAAKTSGHARVEARVSPRVNVRGRARLMHRYGERFTASSYADDVTAGDVTTGEDPVVRAAAIAALGNMNGTVLAIDPSLSLIH